MITLANRLMMGGVAPSEATIWLPTGDDKSTVSHYFHLDDTDLVVVKWAYTTVVSTDISNFSNDSEGRKYYEPGNGYRYTRGIRTYANPVEGDDGYAFARTTAGYQPENACPALYNTIRLAQSGASATVDYVWLDCFNDAQTEFIQIEYYSVGYDSHRSCSLRGNTYRMTAASNTLAPMSFDIRIGGIFNTILCSENEIFTYNGATTLYQASLQLIT